MGGRFQRHGHGHRRELTKRNKNVLKVKNRLTVSDGRKVFYSFFFIYLEEEEEEEVGAFLCLFLFAARKGEEKKQKNAAAFS